MASSHSSVSARPHLTLVPASGEAFEAPVPVLTGAQLAAVERDTAEWLVERFEEAIRRLPVESWWRSQFVIDMSLMKVELGLARIAVAGGAR